MNNHKRNIAIIDAGSNSVRMLVAQQINQDSYWVLHEVKQAVRLGAGLGISGVISDEAITRCIQTLKWFNAIADGYQCTKRIAVATAAIRNAQNSGTVLERIVQETGIHLNVLSGQQEAHYDFIGAMSAAAPKDALIMDLGGGSCELILVKDRKKIDSACLQYGAVTITEMFSLRDKITKQNLQAAETFYRLRLETLPWLKQAAGLPVIAVGGSLRNLGKIIRKMHDYPLDMTHGYTFGFEDVQKVYHMACFDDFAKRRRIPGLSKDRVDLFGGAMAIIHTVLSYQQCSHVFISGAGVREGALLKTMLPDKQLPLENPIESSAHALLSRSGTPERHARHVQELSLHLFDCLRERFGLPTELGPIISAAALLHDCGIHTGYYDHHQHSFYQILHAGLKGMDHRQMLLTAAVAAGHRKDAFTPMIERYKDILQPDDAQWIYRLGVIVRIAESFCHSICDEPFWIDVKITSNSVEMAIGCQRNLSMEIHDAATAGSMFENAYNCTLSISQNA